MFQHTERSGEKKWNKQPIMGGKERNILKIKISMHSLNLKFAMSNVLIIRFNEIAFICFAFYRNKNKKTTTLELCVCIQMYRFQLERNFEKNNLNKWSFYRHNRGQFCELFQNEIKLAEQVWLSELF